VEFQPRVSSAPPPASLDAIVSRFRDRRPAVKIPALLQIAAVIALGVVFALPAASQDKKSDAQLRTIRGTVLDKDETPRPSGIVYLLNAKTQAVKTYIADEAGNYRFSGLDPNVDYEVHAEFQDMTSGTRTISSFDSRRDVEIPLKLSRKKSAK
jgi:Carboxypeptidase regulatory-like domain